MKRFFAGLTMVLALLVLFSSCDEIMDALGLNDPPIANAGPDQTVDFGELVILNGQNSSDPDGDQLDYSWTLAAYEPGSALRSSDISAATTQRASVTPDVPGIFIFTLTVSQENGASSSDDVQITVREQVEPETPTGLHVSASTDTSLTLSWNDSDGAEYYTLYRDFDEDGLFISPVHHGSQTTYQNVGLITGVTYYYKVLAGNDAGDSELSLAVSGTPGAVLEAPDTPTGLAVTSSSDSAITLTWNIVSGAASYQVERSTDDSTFTEVYDDASNTFTDYTVSGGTTYYYRVSASNSGGSSDPSASLSVSTGLSVPTGLAVGTPTQTTLTISWTDVGAPAYTLAKSTDNSIFTEISDATSPYVDSGLNSGTEYFYKVKSTNGGSESAYTTVKSGLTKPATPAQPTVDGATESTLTVSWAAVGGAESYTVYTDTDTPDTFDVVVVTTPDLEVVVFGLTPNTPYDFQVRAWNESGFSGYSATGSGTTALQATVVPDAPTGLAVLGIPTSTSVTITWDPAANAAYYEVYSNSAGPFASIGETGATMFTEDGLNPDTTYTFYVVAWNSQGPSADSATLDATTNIGAPDTPGAPWIYNETNTTLDIAWDPVTGADNYTLYRSTDNEVYEDLFLVIPGTTYQDTGLDPGKTYYYKVQAFNLGGPSGLSTFGEGTTTSSIPIPANVAVDSTTVSSITISWDDTGTADSYVVFRDNFETGSFFYVAGEVTAPTSTFTDELLEPGTTYYYKVKAVEGAGLSGFSPMVFGTTLEDVPATPTGLAVGGETPTSLYVSWDFVPGAANYRLVYSDDTPVYFGPNRFYNDEGLDPSTVYAYKIRAENSAGESLYSGTAAGETLPALLEPPLDVDAAPVTSTSIDVTWASVDSAFYYKIYRQREDSMFNFLAEVPGTVTTYRDENLPSGTTFGYKLKTGSASGESDYSASAVATTLGPQQPDYMGGGTDPYAAWLDWGWSDGADGYYLYRSDFDDQSFVQIGTFFDTYTDDRGLEAGSDYYYYVTAFIGGDESTPSPVWMARTDDPPMNPPGEPFFWTDYTTSQSFFLRWDTFWDVRSYQLYMSTNGTAPWGVPIYDGSDDKFLIEGLEPDTQYWFLLVAENDAGTSGLTNIDTWWTNVLPTEPPGIPMIAGSTDDWDYRVDIWWDWMSGAEFYVLERSSDGGASWEGIFSGPNTGFSDMNLDPGEYSYRVAAANAVGQGGWSDPTLDVEVSGTGEVIIIIE